MEKILLSNPDILILLILLSYEIISRLLKTKVDISLVNFLKSLLDITIPNRKKSLNNSDKNVKHK